MNARIAANEIANAGTDTAARGFFSITNAIIADRITERLATSSVVLVGVFIFPINFPDKYIKETAAELKEVCTLH
ncbi:MAG: hypothetical protein DRJ52_00390 [Thermoprotei archaeon]|nr:MAG: hypothetical protein DRJ52_00390 [Thermoprotei archaeon]RLF00291.1 MAG: hypothetical protein DRJ63_02845 [Thermoprotei archaeon]